MSDPDTGELTFLRGQLDDIAARRGELTPQAVLDEARSRRHPLHGRFEWNDTEAAEKYRLAQARNLIRSVRVSYVDGDGFTQTVRAYHAVARPGGFEYKALDDVAADPVLTELVRRDMRRDWLTLRRRYEKFDEFLAMIAQDLQLT